MHSRTYTFLWIPFVVSIGTISWALLLAGIAMMAAVILAPAIKDVNDAQATQNDYQATLDLLDQKIALQKDFLEAATKDPLLMERLASRQLNLNRKDQEIIRLDPTVLQRDRSVDNLIAESLTPVTPKPVPAMHVWLGKAMNPAMRPLIIIAACAAMAMSFFLSVKFERA